MLAFGIGPDTDRLSALYRYGVLDADCGGLFDVVVDDLSRKLGGMTVQLVFVDDHKLWKAASAGAPLEETAGKLGSLSAAVLDRTEPLVLNDASKDAAFMQNASVIDAPYLRAYLGVSVRTPDNHAIGTLFTADTKPRSFQPGHVTLLERGADHIVQLLEERRAERLDAITGAMRDQPFREQTEALSDLATRHKRDLSLLIIEVDPFRTLLETFKADLGVLLIDRMGGLGRHKVRRLDSFGRLSQSTFAVLLPDTNALGARSLAERLVESLKEGWSFHSKDGTGAAPVGIGVATLVSGFDRAPDLIARALHDCHIGRPTPDIKSRDARVA